MKKNLFAFVFALITAALPAVSQSLNLPLPLGLGSLTVNFEGGTGLSLLNLGASVQLISPLNPGLRARLPETVTIPAGLPLLVRIEPSANSGLAFTGVAAIQLNTLPLFAPSSPRMYAASSGENFSDITASNVRMGSSYRVIGSRGGFSEFLIVSDWTPAATVIAGKLDRLEQIFADNEGAIAAGTGADLAAQLATLRDHIEADQTAAAIQDLDQLMTTVTQHSGTDIPNVWRATHDVVNVAGQLRAAAETLRFSLQELDR
jgi:hypothetical protein